MQSRYRRAKLLAKGVPPCRGTDGLQVGQPENEPVGLAGSEAGYGGRHLLQEKDHHGEAGARRHFHGILTNKLTINILFQYFLSDRPFDKVCHGNLWLLVILGSFLDHHGAPPRPHHLLNDLSLSELAPN